jgi:signal transduction histidine kinase/DNA-binding response OmpR family regulator
MRDYVHRLLAESYEVETVADGRAALEAARRQRPDLVLSDVMMPRLDGRGLLHELRADPQLHDTPLILLSARAGEEARVEGMEAGADDYLIKPFSARELVARVRGHLEMARVRREAAHRESELRAEAQASEARVAAEAEALARLNELSSRLWQARDLGEGLEEMLAATVELLGADMGNVQLINPDRGVLLIAAQRGFTQDFLDVFREVSMGDDSACGRALRVGERVVIDDVEADAPFAPFRDAARAAGYRAVQSTPLIGRDGAPLGMLSTHWRAVHRPSGQDLRRLDLYVRQAVDFIERCRADEALREVGRRKDEFLATLAHELRNPLAPIRHAVDILQLKGSPDPTAQAAQDMIDRQVTHMVRLIDDLLDVSRITHGTLELRRQRIELAAIVDQALEATRPDIESAGHTLSVALPPQPIALDADPVRLAQVLVNLLNNACKYTEPGGHLWLTAERDGADVVVMVKDTGIGIPPEHLPRLFEMFSQAAAALEWSQGGLGIGLSLVRSLVELHGGSVAAHSDGPGTGSTFTVRLPILTEPSVPQMPAPARQDGPQAVRRRRMLVVDDNRISAESFATLLRLSGHEVEMAYDGQEAVRKAEAYKPDVILLDIGLPKLNGYDACRAIRAQPWGQSMILVAVTGWGQDDDRRQSRAAGFDGHLVKPVTRAALMQLLASL